jgi:Fe-S-cluster containining protein
MAYHLIESDLAISFLEKAEENNSQCIFLQVTNSESGKGVCSQYEYRPFICRIFGVAARTNKYGKIENAICPTLAENNIVEADNAPLIEVWKKKLEVIDPRLSEQELPINQALKLILEKVLLLNKFSYSLY